MDDLNLVDRYLGGALSRYALTLKDLKHFDEDRLNKYAYKIDEIEEEDDYPKSDIPHIKGVRKLHKERYNQKTSRPNLFKYHDSMRKAYSDEYIPETEMFLPFTEETYKNGKKKRITRQAFFGKDDSKERYEAERPIREKLERDRIAEEEAKKRELIMKEVDRLHKLAPFELAKAPIDEAKLLLFREKSKDKEAYKNMSDKQLHDIIKDLDTKTKLQEIEYEYKLKKLKKKQP
jgi:hypothetical protein